MLNGEEVKFFASHLWQTSQPDGTTIEIEGMHKPGIIHSKGLILWGLDGKMVCTMKNLVEYNIL